MHHVVGFSEEGGDEEANAGASDGDVDADDGRGEAPGAFEAGHAAVDGTGLGLGFGEARAGQEGVLVCFVLISPRE